MDLPIIDPPIFPRWVWIEEITFSHIPIATLITAFMVLAPILEYVGYRRQDWRFERMAKGFIWFAMILFSPGAALGTGIAMWIIGTYPEFWARWTNLFYWPLIAQVLFFLLEVFFLFFCYYLTWDRLKSKRLHIALGAAAAICGLLVQAVWDSLGGYMLTPGGVALPQVNEPVAWSAAAFFNPSFPWLFGHRFVGNISYVMLLVGGWFAICPQRKESPVDREFYRFATDFCVALGFFSFFIMPLIGWGYARVIGEHAPVAFRAIMGGHTSPHFTIKMIFAGTMVLIAGTYLFARHGRAMWWVRPLIAAGVVLVALVFWAHPPLLWFGSAFAWRSAHTLAPLAFLALLWFGRGRMAVEPERWRWWLFAAGIFAMSAFLIGGFVRERSRAPDTVYGEIVKPEVTEREADRYIFYKRCLTCHQTPEDILGSEAGDWAAVVERERVEYYIDLERDEAAAIIRYLEGESR